MNPKGNNPKRNTAVPMTNPARNALSVQGATGISGKTPSHKVAVQSGRDSMSSGDEATTIPVTAKNRPIRKSTDAYAYAPIRTADQQSSQPLPANHDGVANHKGVD